MEGTEYFQLVGVVVCLGILIYALVWVARILGFFSEVSEETAEVVYTTGNSPESFLLKVIITILFPPILLFYLFRLLRNATSSDTDHEEIALENKMKMERLEENERLWRD
jgi:hypothetical protein